MRLEITSSPTPADQEFIAAQVRAHNRAHTEGVFTPLCVFVRGSEGGLIGGLTATTYWDYLDVHYLWVAESNRSQGIGSKLLAAAEAEAVNRGCKHSLLNTFSFQAPTFYPKVGYEEIGVARGFRGLHALHDRSFMYKALVK